MTYQEALEYTHSLLRFGVRPGLERIRELMERLGNPQRTLRVIHVAGTNGKGSTCAMLSSILRAAGYRTGLFISPYVLDFRERIQINGQMIPEADFAAVAEEVRRQAEAMAKEGEQPTEFEFITAVALAYFQQAHCDAVVLETGLGGRLDSTNVVERPLASVITSISLDHTDVLGDTVSAIAAEKAGIIKPNGLCITCPDQDPEALGVLMEQVALQNARLCLPSLNALEIQKESLEGTEVLWRGKRLLIPFCGRFQLSNALCAIETAVCLNQQGLVLEEQAIRRGVEQATLPARMECLCTNPLILLDGTHNPDGARVLSQLLQTHLKGQKAVAVWGTMKDKNYAEVLRTLAPHFSFVYTVTPDNPRSLPAEELALCLRSLGVESQAAQVDLDLVRQGVERAAGCPLILLGSFYLASQIRPLVLEFLQKK